MNNNKHTITAPEVIRQISQAASEPQAPKNDWESSSDSSPAASEHKTEDELLQKDNDQSLLKIFETLKLIEPEPPAMAPATGKQSEQAVLGGNNRSLVPEPKMYDGNREGFSDWWRGMTFFLKYNDIKSADKKVIAILSRMQRGIAGVYTAK